MKCLPLLALLVAVLCGFGVGANFENGNPNYCEHVPVLDPFLKPIPQYLSLPGSIRMQLSQLSSQGEKLEDYHSFQRKKGEEVVSVVYWNPCRTVPAAGCGADATCCEVFANSTRVTCGRHPNTTIIQDAYSEVQENQQTVVAGVTLQYRGGTREPRTYAGAAPPGYEGEAPLCFQLDVRCNPFVEYYVVETRAQLNEKYGEPCLRVNVESQYGCFVSDAKALHRTSWKILFYILAPLAMLSGLLLTFFGWRLLRLASLILGLFFGLTLAGVLVLVGVFVTCALSKPPWAEPWTWAHECTFHFLTSNPWAGWISSTCGILLGVGLAALSYKAATFGIVLVGMTIGLLASDLLYSLTFSIFRLPWIQLILVPAFVVLGAMCAACLPSRWKRRFFIIAISSTGAYLFVWGIGVYAMNFPSMTLLEEASPRWQYALYLIAIALLALAGAFVQFKFTGAISWDTIADSGLLPRKRRRVLNDSLLENERDSAIAMTSLADSAEALYEGHGVTENEWKNDNDDNDDDDGEDGDDEEGVNDAPEPGIRKEAVLGSGDEGAEQEQQAPPQKQD